MDEKVSMSKHCWRELTTGDNFKIAFILSVVGYVVMVSTALKVQTIGTDGTKNNCDSQVVCTRALVMCVSNTRSLPLKYLSS